MSTPKILVVSGLATHRLLQCEAAALATKELALADADVTRISLADYPLPIYDADVAKSELPQNAVGLKQLVGEPWRHLHCEPGIQRFDHAASEERDRLDLGRARARQPQLYTFQNRASRLAPPRPAAPAACSR